MGTSIPRNEVSRCWREAELWIEELKKRLRGRLLDKKDKVIGKIEKKEREREGDKMEKI